MSHRPASSPTLPAGRSTPRARRMIIACGMAVFLAAARFSPPPIIANVGGDVADVRVSACGAAQRCSGP